MPGNTEHTTNQMRNLQRAAVSAFLKNGLFKWFHKGVGLIYLCAAFPLLFQIGALIGENGLSPAHELLQKVMPVRVPLHLSFSFRLCSICSSYLCVVCPVLLTCVGGLMLLAGIRPFYGALLAWGSFLSICSIGGDFSPSSLIFSVRSGFFDPFSKLLWAAKKAVP